MLIKRSKNRLQIKLIQRKDIDSQKWDACVCQNGHGIIYGLSVLDCLTESSWSAFIIEDYRAVLPFYPKTKYFYPIYQPTSTVQILSSLW